MHPPSSGNGSIGGGRGAASIFSGTVPATFDPKKARISVPAGFRNALGSQGPLELIGRRSSHSPCIEIWPKATFDAEVKHRTAHLDPFSREFEKLMRRLVAHAHALTPDGEGRMVLPKELVEKAALETDVVFSGRHSFFQLWSAKNWEAALAEDDAEEAEA
jgi:MraZ protein